MQRLGPASRGVQPVWPRASESRPSAALGEAGGGGTGAGPGTHTIPARLPRPNNPHGTHYNLARQQQRVSAAGQRGPPPPKAQSCPS